MSSANYKLRRATVDDQGALKRLWESLRISEPDLEKRLTEFQIAEDRDGKLLGALALQIIDRSGRIHGEAFTDFALAEQLRPLLWERVQAIALNHGLARLWTQEDAPFWARCGLVPADAKALEKLPPAWTGRPAAWLTVQLRDETATVSLDKEFALFMESEKQRSAKALSYARTLKTMATVTALILALFVVAAIIRLLLHNRQLPGH